MCVTKTTASSFFIFIIVIIITNVLDITTQVINSQTIPLPSGAQQLIIDRHNKLRARLGIRTQLSWSPTIALFAQGRAMFQRCNGLSHAGLRQYGENLAMGSGSNTVGTIDSLLKLWMNEGVGGGHYDQMVWNDTTEVGCAVSSCKSDLYLVCNYNPPGNVIGQSIFSGGYHPSLPSIPSQAINRILSPPLPQLVPKPSPPSPSVSKKNVPVLASPSTTSTTTTTTTTTTTSTSTPTTTSVTSTIIPTFALLPLYSDTFTTMEHYYPSSPTPPPSSSSSSSPPKDRDSNIQPLTQNSAMNLSLSSSSLTTLLVSLVMAITTFLVI